MAVALGWVPLEVVVHLVRGSDFISTLRASVTWPVGTQIALLLSPTPSGGAPPVVWPAFINGVDAEWDVPATDVDYILDARANHVQVRYTEPDGTVIVWMQGVVHAD